MMITGTLNRGFAFVEYATHKAAAKARRKLLPANFTLWGQTLTVDWATPEPEVGDSSLPSVTNLYCRNLNTNLDEHRLNQFFSFNGRLMLVKVKKMKNYAFLNYQTREDAQKALNYLKSKFEFLFILFAVLICSHFFQTWTPKSFRWRIAVWTSLGPSLPLSTRTNPPLFYAMNITEADYLLCRCQTISCPTRTVVFILTQIHHPLVNFQ